jgi:hypothetical protein
MRRGRRLRVSLIGAAALTAAAPAAAQAVITPTTDAVAVARAIADRPSEVVGAAFETAPPRSGTAISTTRLGQFPSSGPSFAILSTGDPRNASAPNSSPGTGTNLLNTARGVDDVTVLRIDLNVPASARCLSVRFRYYSEEFPEFVGDFFNDAFIAELDRSTWNVTGTAPGVSAIDNFAFDVRGRPITVNSIGPTSVAAARAADTTYDAGTRRLRASVPISPGRHSLYLSIFDQGDPIFDSSAFVDRLTLDRLNPCTRGAVVDVAPGRPAGAVTLPSGRVSIPAASVFGSAARLVVRDLAYRPSPIRTPGVVRLSGTVRDTRGFVVRGARVKVLTLPGRFFRSVGEVRSRRDGRFTVALRPTPAFQARGDEVWAFIRARKPGGKPEDRSTGVRLVRLTVR